MDEMLLLVTNFVMVKVGLQTCTAVDDSIELFLTYVAA